jgi:hypothetical protein
MKPEKSPPKKAAKPAPKIAVAGARSELPVKRAAAAKKTASKKSPPAIPAILLEGDRPPALAVSGPGARYALGPTPPAQQLSPLEGPGELPEAYGTQRLLLTARDPHWLYAHWDLTRGQLKKYNTLSADGHLVLRVYLNAVSGQPLAQVHVHPESLHWFLHVERGGAAYVAELGYFQTDGQWSTISASTATLTPPDTLSEDTSARFETIPVEVPFEQLLALVKTAARENVPLAEAIQQLRAVGHANLPDAAAAAAAQWTPAQERALAAVITMDHVRRVWMGSLEITELIRRQLQQGISSAAVSGFSQPAAWSGAVGSLASPFGGARRQKSFWFNVNAELIIYGATEPNAKVSIGGRVIKLRPDGTFSYRFAFPDGTYELPAIAVSADGDDGRMAELAFSRASEYRGQVGAHPQDPSLRVPAPQNIS